MITSPVAIALQLVHTLFHHGQGLGRPSGFLEPCALAAAVSQHQAGLEEPNSRQPVEQVLQARECSGVHQGRNLLRRELTCGSLQCSS